MILGTEKLRYDHQKKIRIIIMQETILFFLNEGICYMQSKKESIWGE